MQSEQEVHLRDYLRVLRKRRWTVIAFFVILVTTVAVGTFTARPVYRSVVQILIERENPNVVSIQEVLAIDATATDYYQTQYEILKSETLARRVGGKVVILCECVKELPEASDYTALVDYNVRQLARALGEQGD